MVSFVVPGTAPTACCCLMQMIHDQSLAQSIYGPRKRWPSSTHEQKDKTSTPGFSRLRHVLPVPTSQANPWGSALPFKAIGSTGNQGLHLLLTGKQEWHHDITGDFSPGICIPCFTHFLCSLQTLPLKCSSWFPKPSCLLQVTIPSSVYWHTLKEMYVCPHQHSQEKSPFRENGWQVMEKKTVLNILNLFTNFVFWKVDFQPQCGVVKGGWTWIGNTFQETQVSWFGASKSHESTNKNHWLMQ